ncbi:MAG: cobyrinate a,c-diamide synthase [Desulfobacterota bacterium]|nr:cobyrinate a,c-diamide synthase [Thermodesulfobacteriota bacterium]
MATSSMSDRRGFVIAGERSGVGKTMITLALARALMLQGYSVQCFKVGPDFIDPGYHAAVTGRLSRNLDERITSPTYCRNLFYRESRNADIVIVEGVMGLFDGYGNTSKGSTAQIARLLDLPVILIIDGSSLSQTAGALALGLQQYDLELKIAGILFNKVSSKRHYETLRAAVVKTTGIPVLGYIPRAEHWHVPHRHLGLVMAGEQPDLIGAVERCATDVEQTVALSKITRNAPFKLRQSVSQKQKPKTCNPNSINVRIGVARDEAFCFCYQDNIELLERFGGKIVFFSPLHDAKLPESLHGLYLPGGYPELYAAQLSANQKMRRHIRAFCESGKPVYAECGGFLYLLRAIVDYNGKRHAMAGFFPTTARMRSRLQRFGYVTVRALPGCPFLPPHASVRGHEFHYSDIDPMPNSVTRTLHVRRRTECESYHEGYVLGAVLAGYPHLHFASNPAFARNFVAACAQNRGMSFIIRSVVTGKSA